jgi:hypothetical protein
MNHPTRIPPWMKLIWTLLVCAILPAYWQSYGPTNFLWFSDIALILTAIALWMENSLLASMMAIAVALPEVVWNLSFFSRLIFGVNLGGLAGYMFDPQRPILIRGLSLFHIFLPIVLIWLVHRLGYDRRAMRAQIFFGWLILMLTYLLTKPADNINWVFGPGSKPQHAMPPLAYLVLVMLFFPLVIYLPTAWLLAKMSRAASHG